MAGAEDVWSHCSHQEAKTRIKGGYYFQDCLPKVYLCQSDSVSQRFHTLTKQYHCLRPSVQTHALVEDISHSKLTTQAMRVSPHFHSSSLAYFIFFSVYF